MKSVESKPELIYLVESHVRKVYKHWNSGLYIVALFRDPNSYRFEIWGRAAGVLVNNKYYCWREIGKPLIPVHVSDPKFLDVIIESIGKAFCRSGDDVHWLRPYPLR